MKNYNSVKHFCESVGLNPQTVGNYLNLQINPISKRNNKGVLKLDGYFIKKSAVRIAEELDCNLFDLFPSNLWNVISKIYTIETSSENFIPFNDNQRIQEIDNSINDFFEVDNLEKVLGTLTKNEEVVISKRFFGNETLMQISKHLSVSKTRVQQIEAKALRKLRHPSRANKLLKPLEVKHETLNLDGAPGTADHHFPDHPAPGRSGKKANPENPSPPA